MRYEARSFPFLPIRKLPLTTRSPAMGKGDPGIGVRVPSGLRRKPFVRGVSPSKPLTKTKAPWAAEVGAGFGEGFSLRPAQPVNKTSSARSRMGKLRAELNSFIVLSGR
jgi:hypothetical protein